MPSGLTGDFDLVLQIGNTTLDRLAAAMHQNGFADPDMPSLPHISYFRIGDTKSLGGERGSIAAQIGTPHIVLIDGATDRFWVETGFRAHYRADPGSTPLADVINGTIRAMYRIRAIDPDCPGWKDIADDYVWLRVVQSSVSFDGAAYSQSDELVLAAIVNQAEINQRITKHLAALLAGPFTPKPHRVGRRFKRIRTLSTGPARGGSAVVVPLGLGDEVPKGNLASVTRLFVGRHDFALAVSSDFIVDRATSHLASMSGLRRDIHVHGDAGLGGGLELDYHIGLDSLTATWHGAAPFGLPMGVIKISVAGTGWATKLYRSGVYDVGSVDLNHLRMSFTADQFLAVKFDAVGERLSVEPLGAPSVAVSYKGPFASYVRPRAEETISAEVRSKVAASLGAAQTELSTITAPDKKAAMIEMLRSADAAATARLTHAEFLSSGLVIGGSISLRHRHAPRVSFKRTPAGDGFDAIESWIPGGRVDTFEWTWRWFTNPIEPPRGQPGAETNRDTFLLRRHHRSRSRFGLAQGTEVPLPGLDGQGRVCLTVKGTHVDHVTGEWVPVVSVMDCAQFGFQFKMPIEMGPYVRVCDPLKATARRVAEELGTLHVGAPPDVDSTQNTLVVHMNDEWDEAAAESLTAGVSACRRRGAGLLVLVLFREGALDRVDRGLKSAMSKLGVAVAAPVLITEDVRGAWARCLALPESPSATDWRLVNPRGVTRWVHQGHLEAGELAEVLDDRLEASRPAQPGRIGPTAAIGDRLPVSPVFGTCPPPPVQRPGSFGSKFLFIDAGNASKATLARLQQMGEDAGGIPYTAVIVDGATADEARSLQAEFGIDVPTFPDPDSAFTRAAGVHFTPSEYTLNGRGRLIDIRPHPVMTSKTAVRRQI